MKRNKEKTSNEEFEEAVLKREPWRFVLRLFVTGMTPKSTRAIANLKIICEDYLEGRYELKVIDIYQQPKLAQEEQIIGTPTLIKQLPLPFRKLIGDMSDTEKVLVGIDLKPKNSSVEVNTPYR
jgi:circadian clock protein KaiB